MKYVFISGIPAAGKSYIAERVAKTIGVMHIDIDEWREEMKSEPELKSWVDFFWNKNEEEYWRITSCEEHWENLKKQSEAFWPTILKRIKKIQKSDKPAIFEGVNILPYLAHRDFPFKGIVLLGRSVEEIFERNKRSPRWGQSKELQKIEAEKFYNCEGPMYRKDAEKYNFKVFTDPIQAEKELLRLLQ